MRGLALFWRWPSRLNFSSGFWAYGWLIMAYAWACPWLIQDPPPPHPPNQRKTPGVRRDVALQLDRGGRCHGRGARCSSSGARWTLLVYSHQHVYGFLRFRRLVYGILQA